VVLQVHVLSQHLQQILLISLQDPLTLAAKDPTKLVTWVRIIEKEERLDARFALKASEKPNSVPPAFVCGAPKVFCQNRLQRVKVQV
jgi:hypothetical protein